MLVLRYALEHDLVVGRF